MNRKLEENRHQLSLYIEKLKGLSPAEKLNQGFSHVSDARGKTVTDIESVEVGELVLIHVKNGQIQARVEKKEAWQWQKEN